MTKKRIFLYLGSLLSPLILLSIVWMTLGVTPFGVRTLQYSDAGSQYLEFLHYFKNSFTQGFSIYSFTNGIGDSITALGGYYLVSPFNFLLLFFPEAYFPTAIVLIISLKIACMSLAMNDYLLRHYKAESWEIWLFDCAYSFCGFVVAYNLNFMWLDGLIYLPLVVLGLEKFWQDKTPGLYGIALWLSILTNYYIGYMICIFAFFYSLYLYWLNHPQKNDWHLKIFFTNARLFVATSLIAGISTSVVVIPSLLGMLQTAKTSFSLSNYLPVPRFLFSAFSQFGVASYDFSMRLHHLPTIYVGLMVTLFSLYYFLDASIPKRQRKAGAVFLLALLLSFIIQLFNTIWHMFQSPAGFPYRNAFVFCFLLISFGYQGFLSYRNERKLATTPTRVLHCGEILAGVLILGKISWLVEQYFTQHVLKLNNLTSFADHLILSLFFVAIYTLLLVLSIKKPIGILLIAFLSLGELSFNLLYSFNHASFGNQQTYAKYFRIIDNTIETMVDGQPLFRINEKVTGARLGYTQPYVSYNDPAMFDFAGVSDYSSTLNKNVLNTMINLGVYSKNQRRFSYVDNNPVLNLLLNVRYTISPTEIAAKELLFKKEGVYGYHNPEAVGAGLFVDDPAVSLKSGAILENLNTVLQGIRHSDTSYFSKAKVMGKTHNDGWQTITIKQQTTGQLMMYLPQVDWEKVAHLTINGEKHKTKVKVASNQLYNLGTYQAGEIVKIRLKTQQKINLITAQIADLDQEQFETLVTQAKKHALQLKEDKTEISSRLSGSLSVEKKEQEVFLAIPFDTNWHVYMDGKEIAIKKIYSHFIGIELPQGKHKIQLIYHSTPLIAGACISGITIFLGLVTLIFYHKK